MRILYENQIDDLEASLITALTEATLYEATQVQDERLSTRWKTTAATDQTIIFDAGQPDNTDADSRGDDGQPMFQATTNLVTDPENMTSANWTEASADVSTADSILGIPAYEITANAAASSQIQQVIASPATTMSMVVTMKKTATSPASSRVLISAPSAGTNYVHAQVTWATKGITYVSSSEAFSAQWIDDETVRLFCSVSGVDTASEIQLREYVSTATAATGESVIFSAPILVDNSYPLAYCATSRAAWSSSIAHQLPPSGKFIIDCEFFPYFAYDTASFQQLASFYVLNSQRFIVQYSSSVDKFRVYWEDGGTGRDLASAQYDDGTSYRNINQRIRLVASIDIATGGVTTGSRLFLMSDEGGYFAEDDTEWSGAIDALSSTFPTLELGQYASGDPGDIFMHHFRIYGGTLENTITTEEDLDDELATKTLTFSREYSKQFDIDAVAIMGHNISPEAEIKVQLNDWNEWNYTDGSGSSIIEQSLTWHEDTPILYFFPERYKRRFAKFTINDPNNDAAAIEVGRFWIGEYLDISPSSLIDFKVTKKNSDRTIYGRNRQKWSDEGVDWRKFDLSFPVSAVATAASLLDKVQRMYDSVGAAHSVIFCNFDSIRDYQIVEPCYCSIVGDMEFQHRRSQRYTWGLTLEEDR